MTTADMAWHLLQFGSRKDRVEAAALQQRISKLQAELDYCRGLAGHRAHLRYAYAAGVAAVILALGFALGVNNAPLRQAVADAAVALGLANAAPDVDAGNAAYQKGSYVTALRMLRPLAEQGDVRAQSTVALIFYHGRGVRQDDAEAAKWFRLAADQGDAPSQFNLGVMYAEGQGVPQDDKEAVEWYRRAADQNNAQAQYNLGLWYATKGEPGSQDYVSAHMWFNLAAARFPASDTRNRGLAVKNRDVVANKMSREDIDEAQKLAREWKPK
jgi:TPR repeat protein